ERRAGSTSLRVKNAVVHSRIRRTVHVPPSAMWRILGVMENGNNVGAPPRVAASASHVPKAVNLRSRILAPFPRPQWFGAERRQHPGAVDRPRLQLEQKATRRRELLLRDL